MKLLFFIPFLLGFSFVLAQNTVEKNQNYSNNISTKKINALLGTTRLFAIKSITEDSSFVHFLNKNKGYTKEKKVTEKKVYTIYNYPKEGIRIKTRKTGIGYQTIDNFVEIITIQASKNRKLPYNCHSNMSYRAFKKKLKIIGFKKNNSKSKRVSKLLKKEVFSTNTVILEIWFDENIFSKMVLHAQLNNMYGGLLIIK